MATYQIAKWASQLDFSSLPSFVYGAAIRSFHNSLGTVLGGAAHPTTQRAIEALTPLLESKTCTVLAQERFACSGGSAQALFCDLQNAAFINGIASHVHDYDDTHLHTVIHPAGAVVASLLAYAEHHKAKTGNTISGKDFLTALVAGIEVGLRLGIAVSPNHYSEGWHITGTTSPIAVAAALSNLLHLSPNQTQHAIGIASTQPVGIRVHFGTDTKALHVGRAAQNGVLAAILAQGGTTAAPDSLEGRRGWIEVLGNGANSLDQQVNQLLEVSGQANTELAANNGTLWEIEKNTFKPFPCGIVIHPTIDACIQLFNEHQFNDITNVEKILSVHLRVHHLVLDLTGKKTPRDGLEAKFSVYHGAAIGLVLGSATPAEYDDAVVNDKRGLDVRSKVIAEVDGKIRSDEAVVTLTMSDGSKLEKHVEHAAGSLGRPMTNDQLKEKFLRQAEPVLGADRATRLEAILWGILSIEDVTTIAQAAR